MWFIVFISLKFETSVGILFHVITNKTDFLDKQQMYLLVKKSKHGKAEH